MLPAFASPEFLIRHKMGLNLIPLEGFPLVKPGDDLASLVAETLAKNGFSLQDGDIVVLAQKIVSKAEDRLVNLTTVDPSEAARDYAHITGKDPRLVELILSECREVVRVRQGLMIVEHRLGFISANAGIDPKRCTPHASLIGLVGRSSLVSRHTSLPSLSTSITRLPRVHPIKVLPSGRRMAVNGMCGVFTSHTTLPFGSYSRTTRSSNCGTR